MPSGLSSYDLFLFHEGTLAFTYRMLGAHVVIENGVPGVRFSVWAPNAQQVCVVGDFNHWLGASHVMERVTEAGVWSLFIPGLQANALYKFAITCPNGKTLLKADPYAFWAETPPATASRVIDLAQYTWADAAWLEQRRTQQVFNRPINIYEVHLGSWRRNSAGQVLSYKQLADELPQYAAEMGYTHIELLPLAEHPFDGSWGYQVTGYFAVTSRYGTPHEFMYFVDRCHNCGLGVIIDWVPGHFCRDAHGLACFDGPNLYEHGDNLRALHPEWGTLHFDYGRDEVRSFLTSNAVFWFDMYHIDGLRTDAVSSMVLYDHGRRSGQWAPNKQGGRENLEAITFLQQLNTTVFKYYPHALMIAEEATNYAGVTQPSHLGGLGFNYKWNMGWMNDTLRYMQEDPLYRKHKHNQLTFSLMYAFSENFILPLSHDEVVHGKRSLLDKMPGDYWQKFANLRALYGYMMAHPGKKHLFMGGEFGQFVEWRFYSALDWHLLEYNAHAGLQAYVRDLNRFYQREAALWELDHSWAGFTWIEPNASEQSLLVFMRHAANGCDSLVVVCNFTPQVHRQYRLGLPDKGDIVEALNSDAVTYGGTGLHNTDPLQVAAVCAHGQPYSVCVTVPPLATVFFRFKKARAQVAAEN